MCLYTRLTEFFLNCRCLLCFAFYIAASQPNECTWRRMSLPSRNFYICKQVTCSDVVSCLLVYPLFLYCTLLLPVYFFIPFFIPLLLLYFCLFSDHVNKPIIFVFGAFVYNFKKTISSFVTILYILLSFRNFEEFE